MRIGMHYGRQIKAKGLDYLNLFEFLFITSLLLIAGVAGPSSQHPSNSTDSTQNFEDSIIKDKFSVVHYNIQSISNKVDVIESELRKFDIICLTETWLDQITTDDSLTINGFKLYRRDRSGDNHGGICVFANQNIFSRRRNDLELPNIECVWIEVSIHHRKILIGSFYRPPNAPAAVLSSIEDSIGLAYDTNIQNIVITGDFNLDILKQTSNKKVSEVCQHFNLEQLITEPTHFTETSFSTIDLFLTSNKKNVLLSGVGEPFLDQNIRYHCPIYCVLNFDKIMTPTYTRHIWLCTRGDYQSLSDDLRETDWHTLKNTNIDIYEQT